MEKVERRLEYVRSYCVGFPGAGMLPSVVAELASYETPDDLDIELWSAEGDILHQMVDCVVMGPYSSADMFRSVLDSRRLPYWNFPASK